ncbi:MAG: Gfo/Idh/MocA family oxidoreductase [Abditibacteriaceae bacterium]
MIKIAIVGVGGVATGNYLPFLNAQQDVEFGYYNRTPKKAEAAAEQFGGKVYSDLATLAAWQPDLVFVLTNETSRYEVVKELLSLGVKRIFCEKPLVAAQGQAHVSEEDFYRGKELLDLARQNQCEMAMMFNYRFFDHSLLAKKLVAERQFGQMIHVAGQVHYACWSHCIDLIHHFSGPLDEINAISGTVERPWEKVSACDLAAAFHVSNGAVGTLIGTTGMQWQYPLFELIFTFEKGRIHMRDLDGDLEVLDGSTQRHERYSATRNTSRWDHYSTSFDKALVAYLESVNNGAPPLVSGMDGLRELQVEAALRRSIAEKRPVRVQEEFAL